MVKYPLLLETFDNASNLIDSNFFDDNRGELIYKLYFQVIELKEKRLMSCYEFFTKLLNLTKNNVYGPIFNFYALLKDSEKKEFISTSSSFDFNPYITKQCFNFIFEILKVIKAQANNENFVDENSTNKFIEDSIIISQIFDFFKNLIKLTKNNEKNNIFSEEDLTYKDIIYSCINILLELITPSFGNNYIN